MYNIVKPFNFHDLIDDSPLYMVHYSLYVCYKKLFLDQDNNFYLISLSILITGLQNNVWIL